MTAASPPPGDRRDAKVRIPLIDLSDAAEKRSGSINSSGTDTPSASRLDEYDREQLLGITQKMGRKIRELKIEREDVQKKNYQFEHILRRSVNDLRAELELSKDEAEIERHQALCEKKRRFYEETRRAQLKARMKQSWKETSQMVDLTKDYAETAAAELLTNLNPSTQSRDRTTATHESEREMQQSRQASAELIEAPDSTKINIYKQVLQDIQTSLEVLSHVAKKEQNLVEDGSPRSGCSDSPSSSARAAVSKSAGRVKRIMRQVVCDVREQSQQRLDSVEMQLSSSASHLNEDPGGSQTFTLPSISDFGTIRAEESPTHALLDFNPPCHIKATQFPSPKSRKSSRECSEPFPNLSSPSCLPSQLSSQAPTEAETAKKRQASPKHVAISFSTSSGASSPESIVTLAQPPRMGERGRFTSTFRECGKRMSSAVVSTGMASSATEPASPPPSTEMRSFCEMVQQDSDSEVSRGELLLQEGTRNFLARRTPEKPAIDFGWQRSPLSLTRPERIPRFSRAPLDTPRGAAVMVVCASSFSKRAHGRASSDAGQRLSSDCRPLQWPIPSHHSNDRAVPLPTGLRRPEMSTMPICCIQPAKCSPMLRFPPLARFSLSLHESPPHTIQ